MDDFRQLRRSRDLLNLACSDSTLFEKTPGMRQVFTSRRQRAFRARRELLVLRRLNGRHSVSPFICHEYPFVGFDRSLVVPFICQDRPFINNRGKTAGFTLIELIITIAIVAIMAAWAIPSFQTFIRDQRLITQSNDVISDVNLARSEAIRRGANITVCPTVDPSAAAPVCAAANDWTTGRFIFLVTTGEVLKVREAVSGSSAGNTLTADANSITFEPNGQMPRGTPEIEFKACDQRGGAYARSISTTRTGRSRVAKPGYDKTELVALTCP
jgi:type IV fimbrial biogenesis protein FimT